MGQGIGNSSGSGSLRLVKAEIVDSLQEKLLAIAETAKAVVAAVAQKRPNGTRSVVVIDMQVVGFRVPGYRWFITNGARAILQLKPGRVFGFIHAVQASCDSIAARFAVLRVGVPAGSLGLIAGDTAVIAPVVSDKTRDGFLILAERTNFLIRRAGWRLATGFKMALELANRQFRLAVAAGN